jgi:NodT family efflux transporter outer membrane factor (OMF) lipoprotein
VQNTGGGGSSKTTPLRTASMGLGVSWEIDLWGRIRLSVDAAQSRIDAHGEDAREARLSLAAHVVDTVLGLRACNYSLQVRTNDIQSRETQLTLTRRRLAVGSVAPVDVARSLSGLAGARTEYIYQQQRCAQQVNALAKLTGLDGTGIVGLVARVLPPTSHPESGDPTAGIGTWNIAAAMPSAPPLQPALPATLLAGHPAIMAAEREVAATWAEIGVAKASRLPTLDLSALLTGNWLHASGSTLNFLTWSLAPSLSVPLFDGGSGAANVDASEARYRYALASLHAALRTTVQRIEDALAAQISAEGRVSSTRDFVRAAQLTLVASEAQWRAGSLGLFELEDTRRQYAAAQESAIVAARDRAQAWVGLILAAGQPIDVTAISSDEAFRHFVR